MTYYSALHYAAKAEAAATTATTLLPYITDISTVAASITNVNTVAGSITGVNSVAADLTNINAVASDLTNIDSVAGDLTNIDAVNANKTNIDTVAGSIANVNTVAGDITNVNAVAGDLTNINAVAADLTNIDNASQYAAEAKQWAIGDPSEPTGNSAKYWAQQAAGQVIPSQTGHSGEFLKTDGSSMSWNAVDALPSQTGQSGKYLTTDGTTASWGTIQQAPSTDNITISLNTDNELQTIGVINQNDTTTALKVWHGTQAEYDAMATHDANTRYYTDGGLSVSLLSVIYPVGSIYITTNSSCPLSTLIAGSTWVLVGQDRVLQGAGTRGAVGTTLNESLPNIKGTIPDTTWQQLSNYYSGAAQIGDYIGGFYGGGSAYGVSTINLNASNSSSTYQDDAPVQPDAYLVNIYRRIS